MTVQPAQPIAPEKETRGFYVSALKALDDARVPYVVGGGYAMAYYTGIARNTKDLDIFVRPDQHRWALDVLADAGYRTEYFYPFWIAKCLDGDSFIDILYNSANGLVPVDDQWFEHAVPGEIHGYATRLVPPEEQLFSKAFVQDHDRFDGADIAHLIVARGKTLDWDRLLYRFKDHEQVLLFHLILFEYVFPLERECIPDDVMGGLMNAVQKLDGTVARKLCRGTNVAQQSYLPDIHSLGFTDARLRPFGPLTRRELQQLPSC